MSRLIWFRAYGDIFASIDFCVNHISLVQKSTLKRFVGKGSDEVQSKSWWQTIEIFHNSCLIRWIQQIKMYKKFIDLTKDWTQIAWLTISHPNHYTRMFFVLMWGCYWILFMHGWFYPIHLIGWKSPHFEKELEYITRKHSSRMRTARLPTLCTGCSSHQMSVQGDPQVNKFEQVPVQGAGVGAGGPCVSMGNLLLQNPDM